MGLPASSPAFPAPTSRPPSSFFSRISFAFCPQKERGRGCRMESLLSSTSSLPCVWIFQAKLGPFLEPNSFSDKEPGALSLKESQDPPQTHPCKPATSVGVRASGHRG